MENTNLCLNSEQYERMLGANATRARNQALIAAGIVLLFLLVFSLIFAVLCFNYKAKRSRIKEALKSTYTNIKAPDMKVRLIYYFIFNQCCNLNLKLEQALKGSKLYLLGSGTYLSLGYINTSYYIFMFNLHCCYGVS